MFSRERANPWKILISGETGADLMGGAVKKTVPVIITGAEE